MSILKSILHRWNKDSKSYDTLHPETEVAQITDFADGIVSKLAATTAISAISALQTDSWFGKMMKWVLDASGVKYLIDTNGFVCFGSLFGGLIIQWGTSVNGMLNVLPIAFNNNGYTLVATANGYVANPESVRVVKVLSKNQIQIISSKDSSAAMGSYWIAMGE